MAYYHHTRINDDKRKGMTLEHTRKYSAKIFSIKFGHDPLMTAVIFILGKPYYTKTTWVGLGTIIKIFNYPGWAIDAAFLV